MQKYVYIISWKVDKCLAFYALMHLWVQLSYEDILPLETHFESKHFENKSTRSKHQYDLSSSEI